MKKINKEELICVILGWSGYKGFWGYLYTVTEPVMFCHGNLQFEKGSLPHNEGRKSCCGSIITLFVIY